MRRTLSHSTRRIPLQSGGLQLCAQACYLVGSLPGTRRRLRRDPSGQGTGAPAVHAAGRGGGTAGGQRPGSEVKTAAAGAPREAASAAGAAEGRSRGAASNGALHQPVLQGDQEAVRLGLLALGQLSASLRGVAGSGRSQQLRLQLRHSCLRLPGRSLRRHSCISRRTAVLLNSGGRRRLSRGGHAETFQTGSGCTVTDTAGATLGRMVRAPTANNPCRCGDLITVDLVGLVQADFIRLSRRP
mmetsp:Transcript_193/g.560  ORF Transcript_193/g.560 Transcript_193/m.560 type:complete len:243 (+) Transcript_193:3554-4282(+)